MVEIVFPLEFIVHGTPVSANASRRSASRDNWRERIRTASLAVLPEGHYATDGTVTVTLFYFPGDEMARDIDNIVKPVLDAMSRHVYLDDRQVERVWVQKFEAASFTTFIAPSLRLRDAVEGDKPLLYIRLADDPSEGLP